MQTISRIIWTSILLLSTACNNGQKLVKIIPTVDIEENIDNLEIKKLTEFTHDVRYVLLENKENYLLNFIFQLDISGNLILAADYNNCQLYDATGHFISKIGNKGRGPGEYQYINNISLIKDTKVYLSSLYDLLEYNLDGSFLKKYTRSFLINDKYYVPTWFPLNDSIFIGHIPNSSGQIEYKAIMVNKLGNIKKYYKNYILFNRQRTISSGFENRAHIYKFDNKIFYKELYNDTLFYLSDNHKFVPCYIFNLGRFKEPLSERSKVPPGDMLRYIYLYNVFQTKNLLLLDCNFGNQFPASRITPKATPIPTVNTLLHNTRNVLGIFDKSSKKLVFIKPTSTDNTLFTSGLYNDFDAGPRFFPNKMVNDSTMVMWIDAQQLKNHISSDDFKKNVPKFPQKKKALEELVNSMGELDNPVLMFVTFRK